MGDEMKKLFLTVLALAVLVGCARTYLISDIHKRFDQNYVFTLDILSLEKEDIYYYYSIQWSAGRPFAHSESNWYCWEFTCDKTGKVISKREYWVGPDSALQMWREKQSKRGVYRGNVERPD